ncbi:MAG: hypothetical protein JWP74_2635 [Marmoricola sp.]|nr:hypothetical protein [Marmoricola sp.]
MTMKKTLLAVLTLGLLAVATVAFAGSASAYVGPVDPVNIIASIQNLISSVTPPSVADLSALFFQLFHALGLF